MKCAACGYDDIIQGVRVPIEVPEGAPTPIIVQQTKEPFKMVLLELPLRDGTDGTEMVDTPLRACPKCGTVIYIESDEPP